MGELQKMQILSLSEFKKYLSKAAIKSFIFSTENQSLKDDIIDVRLTFKEVFIMFSPNIMFFKDGSNSLRVDRVKKIRLSEEPSVLGEVFTIICGNIGDEIHDKELTFIIQ